MPIHGFLNDYVFLIRGLLDLYECTYDPQWIEWSEQLQDIQNNLFWDDAGKAYNMCSANDHATLLTLKDGTLNVLLVCGLLLIWVVETVSDAGSKYEYWKIRLGSSSTENRSLLGIPRDTMCPVGLTLWQTFDKFWLKCTNLIELVEWHIWERCVQSRRCELNGRMSYMYFDMGVGSISSQARYSGHEV